MRLPAWLVVSIASLVAWVPQSAWACAACMTGRDDETRTAFLLTTAFMTALPLGVLGGALWWLRKRIRELEQGPARSTASVGEPGVSQASSSL